MANTPQVNMNSYVGINRTWDTCKDVATRYHREITPVSFGHFLVDQGAHEVNSQNGFRKAPARPRKTVAGMLPSHITSKFKGEQFNCK